MEEKLILLGLYLKEKGAFKCTRWVEDIEPLENLLREYQEDPSTLKKLALKEMERAEKGGIKVLFIKDPSFPQELKEIPYPPLFIYVKGEIPNTPRLAIVGSRKPTPYGKEVAERFSKRLAEAGICLVSGLARGVDTIVHRTCLEKKGKTIAILGSALDVIYPSENRALYEDICASGGAILSEFPLGTKPRRENFPRRNRLISGLSKGVLVIEAGERSGTLITAKWAQEQGREVLAVPGSIFSEQSRGTHYLIKEGAIPVTTPEEILDYFGLTHLDSNQKPPIPLSLEEERVLSLISSYPVHFEELLSQTCLSPPLLLQILMDLELKNLVLSLPGKFYKSLG
jgi:DNA processing protein